MASCAQTVTYCEQTTRELAADQTNRCLAGRSAEERVAWALANLPGSHIMSSSFGAQAAVMLHLVSRQMPDIPVVLVDTGYLFPETYAFIDDLVDRLELNLKVFRPRLSAAWQEARFGRRWETGVKGIESYNRDNKVEPMQRALKDLEAGTWFAGLRRSQGETRQHLEVLEAHGERWKVYPIVDWTDRDVYRYLKHHGLPYHPLWEQGYVSIGDIHTTRSLAEVDELSQTRFFGIKRECGLHEIDLADL